MDNVCIFPLVIHDQTGEELESAYLADGTYVESLELDGPRLLLTYRDPEQRIKNKLGTGHAYCFNGRQLARGRRKFY